MKKFLTLTILVMVSGLLFAGQPYGTLDGGQLSKIKTSTGQFVDADGDAIGACTVYALILTVTTANAGIVLADGYGSTQYIRLDPKNSSATLPLVINFGRNGAKFTSEPYIYSLTGISDGLGATIVYN